MLTVRSTIHIASQTVPAIIPVVQGDSGRNILFTLADFTIPNGASAYVYIEKPSGASIYNSVAIEGNSVLVELTSQSIIEAGDNYGQVRIMKDDEVVTSFEFILQVQKFRGIDATESTSEMNIFDQAVAAAAEQFQEDAEEIAAEVIESIPADYTELSQDVSDLKAEINYSLEQIADNLGEVYTYIEQGSVNTNTGNISDNVKYVRTMLTPVKAGDSYLISLYNYSAVAVGTVCVFYKSDKTFLSSITNVGNKNPGQTYTTITPPTNAYYMRLRWNKSGNADIVPSELSIIITDERYVIDNRFNQLKSNVPFNYGNITTAGLDLDSGDFIHPGFWAVNDAQYLPYHSPTNTRCRIISFASSSNNTIYTYQIVIDAENVTYRRFSTNTSVWSPWVCDNPYSKLAFKPSDPVCTFEALKHTQADTGNYTMIWGSWENRVSRLLAMYDGEANPNGYAISKSTLGKDATNTFDVLLYKVSLGYTNQTTKPVVLLVIGEHGNEPASAMTGYYAYKEILNGALSKYLTYVDFWIVPLMNPYGYEHNIRNNGNDVNLNRDFPANWNYSTDSHNKTDNYSMSQPETNYIINLCLQNRNRILFVCNKHDTGAIGRKIAQNEVDTVGYLTTCLYTDSVINESICEFEDHQVKETDPYIVTACTADLTKKQLIVNNSPHPLDGSLDLFLNSIGIHASLLEGSYGWNDGANVYYDATEYTNVNYATSQIRYITDFFVNYIAWTIQHSEYLHTSDRAFDNYKLKSRKYNETSATWEDIELWYNGTSIVEVS